MQVERAAEQVAAALLSDRSGSAVAAQGTPAGGALQQMTASIQQLGPCRWKTQRRRSKLPT